MESGDSSLLMGLLPGDGERWEGVCDGGGRIDRVLAGLRPDISRTRWRRHIEGGHVWCNGVMTRRVDLAVKAGDRLSCLLPAGASCGEDLRPLVLRLEILFEDEAMLVLNKPAGLVVHPAAGHRQDTLVNALIAHCGRGLPAVGGDGDRGGIVHRLDKDTSGVLVVAKTVAAQMGLAAQFSARTVEKHYVALVHGVLRPAAGRIDRPIGRDIRNRQRMAIVARGGREAITHYETLAAGQAGSLVHVRIETGRTHQIRVHMASLGHAVYGDGAYGGGGGGGRGFGRQMLHAHTLGLRHPIGGEAMRFMAPVPGDFLEAVRVICPGYEAGRLGVAFEGGCGGGGGSVRR